jgi:plasmid stabilization system protein ParE
MSTMKVEFHRLALKDYDNAFKWYEDHSPDTARRFKVAVDEAVIRISKSPELWPQISGQYRWIRVKGFRYMLVFRPRLPDELVIVAVAHTSRRPGYWRRRG